MGRSIQAIVHGTTSGAEHDAVVVLARFEAGVRRGLCTGTLVAPDLVVTARHCVSITDSTAACDAAGQPVAGAMLHGDRAPAQLAVFVGTSGTAPDTTNEAGAAARGKALVVDPATTICNRDLAFVVLDRKLAAGLAPIRLGAPSPSDVLTAVGFGVTEVGSLPASRMQRSGLTLLGTGPMLDPNDARYGAGDAEFLVSESACAGDSGSPILSESGAVLGVASRVGNGKPRDPANVASTCVGESAHAIYASLGASSALVARAFAAVGAKPWLEGEPDPRTAAPRATVDAGPAMPPAAQGSGAHDDGAGTNADVGDGPGMRTGPRAEVAGGCNAGGEPTRNAVEQALGFIGLVAAVGRLRRARRPDDANDAPPADDAHDANEM